MNKISYTCINGDVKLLDSLKPRYVYFSSETGFAIMHCEYEEEARTELDEIIKACGVKGVVKKMNLMEVDIITTELLKKYRK